jgi:hypothetical protein
MTGSARRRVPTIAAAIILLMIVTRAADGQESGASRATAACSYHECALSIAPTWNGLAIVRGSEGRRVANLNFFFPRDIRAALRAEPAAGSDSAFAQAERALALRRAAAVLTDVGAAAVVAALARVAIAGRAERSDRVAGGGGLAALLVSVPIQFAADGALSRAVWWHNLRFAR